MTGTLWGANPSNVTVSSSILSPRSPAPFLIARAIVSFGTDCLRAASTATARRAFIVGSGRPAFAATLISRTSLLKIFPRFAALISRFFWSHWRPIVVPRTGRTPRGAPDRYPPLRDADVPLPPAPGPPLRARLLGVPALAAPRRPRRRRPVDRHLLLPRG